MIYLHAAIANPFWHNKFRLIFNRWWKVAKNKNLEIEFYRHSSLIGFSLSVTLIGDHAGIEFSIDLIGYTFSIHFYDIRHRDGGTDEQAN